MRYQDILNSEEFQAYIKRIDLIIKERSEIEHTMVHLKNTAEAAGEIIKFCELPETYVDKAMAAGLLHGLGFAVSIERPAEYSAILSDRILKTAGFSPEERVEIAAAIACNSEVSVCIPDEITAALVLADHTDIRRNRVPQKEIFGFNSREKINYAVLASGLRFENEEKGLTLELKVDEYYCSPELYMKLFHDNMTLCRQASKKLGLRFLLTINGNNIE